MPAPVRYRPPGAPHLGKGAGRIRDGLEQPRRPPDRKFDRSAPDDRSGTTGRDAGTLGSAVPRLLYRPPFVLLAPVPNAERQHATRDERRHRPRLWLARGGP